MKIYVERENCLGCGNCYHQCPEIFESDEHGYARIKGNLDFAEVPPKLYEKVMQVIKDNPPKCIKVIENNK